MLSSWTTILLLWANLPESVMLRYRLSGVTSPALVSRQEPSFACHASRRRLGRRCSIRQHGCTRLLWDGFATAIQCLGHHWSPGAQKAEVSWSPGSSCLLAFRCVMGPAACYCGQSLRDSESVTGKAGPGIRQQDCLLCIQALT